MSNTSNNATSMNTAALPAHVGGERGSAFVTKRTFVERKDELPAIVTADEIDWSRPARPSMYDKYDSLEIGQAVAGLLPTVASTISLRLKKHGMKLQSVKQADGTVAFRRLA